MKRTGLCFLGASIASAIALVTFAHADPMADILIGKFKVTQVVNSMYTLADPNGRTIYTYEKDAPGKSTCVAACAEQWPPVLAIDADKAFDDFPIITRADGTRQWTYQNKPLYLSVKDTAADQANGQGIDDAWSVVEIPAHDM